MRKLVILFVLMTGGLFAQKNPIQEIVDAARVDSPALKNLLGHGIPELRGRDGVAVWGQEFFFAVESETPATVSIDQEPPLAMKHVAGTNYYYLLKTLRMGRTHQYLLPSGRLGDRRLEVPPTQRLTL
jgi:hypothetical protein